MDPVETQDTKDTSQEPVDVTPKAPAAVASSEDQLAAKIKDDFDKLYGSRFKQVEDRLHGAHRINERLQKELEEVKKANAAPAKPTESGNSWDKIENGAQWKAEIERIAEDKAKTIVAQREAEARTKAHVDAQLSTMEKAKAEVIEKYPDLDPETGDAATAVSKAYAAVLAEHPDYLTNPYGPRLAMQDMEARLKTVPAHAASPAKSKLPATSLPASRPVSTSDGRIILTREQKALCDRHGIKYEDYAKTAAAMEQGAIEAS